MSQRVVLVTGGGTGIGAACARAFASTGDQVIVMGRRRGPLEAVAAEVGAEVVVGDAADSDDVARAMRAAQAHGGLDVLVANAGGGGGGAVTATTDDDWAGAWRANVTTAFACARAAAPLLADRRGSIVLVSSIAGLAAGPEMAGYVTAKHALHGLCRSLAVDLGPEVRVNAVCPGWVRTEMADGLMDELAARLGLDGRDAAYEVACRDLPLRRPAEASEVAAVIAFLASAAASAMTGSLVVVDGGAGAVDLPTVAFRR